MTTIYLIRHAEAEGNVNRRCHGQYDSLLTAKALEQLPYLAERFDEVHLDAVYASDLYRARHTAKAIADRKGMKPIIRPRLREIDMGQWEDRSWAILPRIYPAEHTQWRSRPWDCTLPEGESVSSSGVRTLEELRKIAQHRPGQTIAAVSHGSVIRNVLGHALKLTPEQILDIGWGDNTCVAKLLFEEDGAVRAEYWNDASHLPESLSTFASIGWKDNKGIPTTVQVWFRQYDPQSAEDQALLLQFVREHYQSAYGTDSLLDEAARLHQAEAACAVSPDAVTFGMLDETPVLLALLDAANNTIPNAGMVGSFCISPEYRGSNLSNQLVGQAMSVYRALGREWLYAAVAENNARAQGFYKKFMFEQHGALENECGMHLLMRKRIKVDTLAEESALFDLSEME